MAKYVDYRLGLLFSVLLLPLLPLPLHAETLLLGGEINFKGRVIALPCSLVPGKSNLQVDFGKLSTRDFYLNNKQPIVPFNISLENCNNAVFKSLSITFDGTEDSTLAHHIRSQGAQEMNIAIALQELGGKLIELNKSTANQAIRNGSMTLPFQAAVVPYPEALTQQNIKVGKFSATAYYTLNYQ